MYKKIMLLLLILTLVFSFVSCKSEDKVSDELLNQDLLRLLPDEGFQWAYFGADEYYHEMVLDNVTLEENQAIFRVKGEVQAIPGNSAVTDYNIDLYYVVNHDSIVQNKIEEAMYDSEYDTITLIKSPLEIGNKWSESIKDKNGKKSTINGEIIKIEDNDGHKQYTVVYSNKSKDYTEIRNIIEGYGVTAFKKIVEVDDETYKYSYGLYGKNSGYLNNTEVVEKTEATEKTEEELAEENNEATEENTLEDEKNLVNNAIESFNYAWIDYVNEDDQKFFDYVIKNGVAYKNAKKFNNDGLKEKFLNMNITSIVVNGNVATAKVYEEIEKIKNGEVTIAKYNWLYDLQKVDGKWLINGYTKQN